MKISSSFALICCISIHLSTKAQKQTEQYTFVGIELNQEWKAGDLSLLSKGVIGSNTVNSQMFRDVFFNPTFDPVAKITFLNADKDRTNLYSSFENRIAYKLDSSLGLFIANIWQIGYYSDKHFSDLVLFGNAQFEGINVSTEKIGYFQSNSTKIGVSKKIVDSKNVTLVASASANLVHQYSRINANESSLYTAEDGEYLDLNTSGLSYTSAGSGLVALGLNVDIDFIYRINEAQSVDLGVSDLNFNRAIDAKYTAIDTNFRFEGIQFDVFSDDSPFSNNIDSTVQQEIDSRTSKQRWISLPTNFSIRWNHRLDSENSLQLGMRTVEWGDFGINAFATYQHNFGSNLRLASTLGYGNFNGLIWNEAAEFKSKGGYHIMMKLFGLHSVIAPRNSYNFGLSAGISKNIL